MRNIQRFDVADTYHHVYARGLNRAPVFVDDADKDYLLYLLSRHLSIRPVKTANGYSYPHYRGSIELLSYCVMDNHFHFLLYQVQQGSMSGFMQSVMSGYSAYYNKKHSRRGPVFESRFRSVVVDEDPYLLHVSRYIHLNPRSWRKYRHSSLPHIRKRTEPEWLQAGKILEPYSSRSDYVEFVADYEEHKRMLDSLKHQLAD